MADTRRDFFSLAILCAIVVAVRSTESRHKHVRYDGDQLVAIDVKSADQWERVMEIMDELMPRQEQDVWKFPSMGRPGYIRVPQKYASDMFRRFHDERLKFTIKIFDLEMAIAMSNMKNERVRGRKSKASDIDGIFPTYDEIRLWMEDVVAEFPELASTFSIGETYEGRPTHVLKLGIAGEYKWNVWVDAALHAREWIAPTTAIYIANQLIDGYRNSDPDIIMFLEKLEFHILPVGNPDGYEYTHTTERLWRKTRSPNNGSDCIGTDLNRNFEFQWGGVNAETDPCSNLYMGSAPESEVEVRNIVNYLLPKADTFIMYKSYHSWGQQFFTRWDYTDTVLPPDHEELLLLAWKAVYAINEVNANVTYEAGTAPTLMYPFAGSSSDWARGVANIKYSYLTELRDADGDYAFVAPPSEIEPCGRENWAGFEVLLREIIDQYGFDLQELPDHQKDD
jgi:carboxypeptidase A4